MTFEMGYFNPFENPWNWWAALDQFCKASNDVNVIRFEFKTDPEQNFYMERLSSYHMTSVLSGLGLLLRMGHHLPSPTIHCAVLCHYGDLSWPVAMQRPHKIQLWHGFCSSCKEFCRQVVLWRTWFVITALFAHRSSIYFLLSELQIFV